MRRSFVAALFAPAASLLARRCAADRRAQRCSDRWQDDEVGFHDPSRANCTVTITVDNGDPLDPQSVDIEVKLDANGNGSTSFTVPEWWSVTFNGGGAKEVTRAVEEPQRSTSV